MKGTTIESFICKACKMTERISVLQDPIRKQLGICDYCYYYMKAGFRYSLKERREE